MGEPAEALEPDGDNISALPGADAPLSINRKAEGGLSLQFSFDIPKVPKVMAIGSWTHQQMINGALLLAVVLLGGWTIYQAKFADSTRVAASEAAATNTRANVVTTFNPTADKPEIAAGAYVDGLASVIGDVQIGAKVYVAPFASIRGDEGQPIVIGAGWFLLLRRSVDVFVAAPVMVVAVNAVMAMPFAVRAVRPAYDAASERHERLCAQLGIGGWNRFRLVDWPSLRRPLSTGLAFAMALSLGDLGVIALFGSDAVQTLPYLLYQRMGSYRTADAAGLALLLGAICLLLMLAADRLGRTSN